MEPQQSLGFDESVKQVMQTLPPFIRTYIEQQKYTAVATGLMTKYKLRIDQGGVLELNLLLLLMGINNQKEFTQALIEKAKLDQQTVNSIVQDVNEQIFIPLRKEEEKGTAQPVKIAVPTPPQSAPQPASYFKLENKIPLPSFVPQLQKNVPPSTISKSVLPPKVFLPRPAEALSVGGPRSSTLGDVVRSVLSAPKPIDNSKLLEDHEEPHIEINQVPVAPQGNAARPVVAPENLPGVMLEPVISEAPIPEVRPSPEFPKVEPQMPKPVPVAPIEPKPIPAPITSYSSDPYREPIDEPVDEM